MFKAKVKEDNMNDGGGSQKKSFCDGDKIVSFLSILFWLANLMKKLTITLARQH